MLCYLCAAPNATHPLTLKDKFNDHSNARCPESDKLCSRCDMAINLRCWYLNPNKEIVVAGVKQKGAWSLLNSRTFSWLLSDNESYPKFASPESHYPSEPEKTKQNQAASYPVITELPTRLLIRRWLLEPPEPPFTIVVAESGQKHLLPWAMTAQDRNYFPIMFEKDVLYIERQGFAALMTAFENLMRMEFSKKEILTGQYRSDRLAKAIGAGWGESESIILPYRGTRLLELINHVAGIE